MPLPGRWAQTFKTIRAVVERGKELSMKAYYLLAPLGAAALVAGCAYEPVYQTSPPVAYVQPTYVSPPSTVVLGAGPAMIDSDGDGYANSVDRWPYDARWH
jgi:hypothetical protein